MSRPGIWGGELEMAILSQNYKAQFLLYLSDGKVLTINNTDLGDP